MIFERFENISIRVTIMFIIFNILSWRIVQMYFRFKNSRQERVWVKVWVKKAEGENGFFKKKR